MHLCDSINFKVLQGYPSLDVAHLERNLASQGIYELSSLDVGLMRIPRSHIGHLVS